MSTISNKDIQTLVDKYVKNFKEFESYMKHCVNILRNLNWLIENQFNTEISDYKYLQIITRTVGLDRFFMLSLYDTYYNDCVKKFSVEDKKSIRTNIYYRDDMHDIANIIQDLNEVQDKIGLSSENYEANHLKRNHDINLSFCRMVYSVIENGYTIDENKEYTFDELYHLVLEQKIMVMDSYIESSDINKNQLIEGIKAKKLIFVTSKTCPILGKSYKSVDSFYDMQGENEQKLWYVTNMLFCRYVRYNEMNFMNCEKPNSIRCYKTFYGTVGHILEIINKLERNYKRRRKTVPEKYGDLIKSILISVEEEKMRYEQNLSRLSVENAYLDEMNVNNFIGDIPETEYGFVKHIKGI